MKYTFSFILLSMMGFIIVEALYTYSMTRNLSH